MDQSELDQVVKHVSELLSEGKTLRQVIPLKFRKVLKKCLWGLVGIFFVWCVASYFVLRILGGMHGGGHDRSLWLAWVLVLVVLLCARMAYQFMYLLAYYYDLDDKNVIIRKGVMAKTEVTLPFSKITDVYIERDMADVLFGLFDVHISSPTAQSGKLAHIDGVDADGALILRSLILDRINKPK